MTSYRFQVGDLPRKSLVFSKDMELNLGVRSMCQFLSLTKSFHVLPLKLRCILPETEILTWPLSVIPRVELLLGYYLGTYFLFRGILSSITA